MATTAKGKEILLFESESGELTSYLETGAASGKPVRLHQRDGEPFSAPPGRLSATRDLIAFASLGGMSLFKRETGELVAEAPDFHHATAVAAKQDGSWAVNVVRFPIPEIERTDAQRFGRPLQRLILVDNNLEVSRQALPPESNRTSSQEAARALRLAASPDRLFAAELANYKVYEFDRRLRLRAIYHDPRLQFQRRERSNPHAERGSYYCDRNFNRADPCSRRSAGPGRTSGSAGGPSAARDRH